jgi:tetratricopeptide (TPR) repeat protein
MGAYREGVAYLEQALSALPRLLETKQTIELTIDIHIALRSALLPLGDFARMREHLQKAEMLARSLGEQRRLGWIATFMVHRCVVAGEYDEALRFGQEALTIAHACDERSIEVIARANLGLSHFVRGELADAATLLKHNVELDLRTERFGLATIASAISESWLAYVFSDLGRFDEAIMAKTAVRTAEAANHPYQVTIGLFALGSAHLGRGDFPLALPHLEQCLDLFHTWGLLYYRSYLAATLSVAYAHVGRVDQALAQIASGIEEFRRRPIHMKPAHELLCAVRTCLSAGRIDEAASHAREALALTRRLCARGNEAHALFLSGDVASASTADDPEPYYRQALALAAPLGMRPLVAHCQLGLGKLHGRGGNRGQAQEPNQRDNDVPQHGYGVLAGAGGSRDASAGLAPGPRFLGNRPASRPQATISDH